MNKFDTFYESMMNDAGEHSCKACDNPECKGCDEDAESSMEGVAAITEEINSNGRVAAEAISNIYSLVEDEGREMLDKQAAEKLEDIKEFVSNLLRNLNNRLD